MTVSPIARVRSQRVLTLSLFLGLQASMWLLEGMYFVNCHVIAGFLLGYCVSLLGVSLWLRSRPARSGAAVAGFCLSLVPATAYSFAPVAVLMIASIFIATRREGERGLWRHFSVGFVAGVLLAMGWMLLFADFRGYAAFHLIENQIYFAPYTSFSFKHFLLGLVPLPGSYYCAHSFALIVCAASFVTFVISDAWRAAGEVGMAIPIALGFVGMISLCARGDTELTDGAFVIVSLTLLSLALPRAALLFWPHDLINPWRPLLLAVVSVLLSEVVAANAQFATRLLGFPTVDERARRYDLGVSQDSPYPLIRSLVHADEKILV